MIEIMNQLDKTAKIKLVKIYAALIYLSLKKPKRSVYFDSSNL
jgi:hypothetical protein